MPDGTVLQAFRFFLMDIASERYLSCQSRASQVNVYPPSVICCDLLVSGRSGGRITPTCHRQRLQMRFLGAVREFVSEKRNRERGYLSCFGMFCVHLMQFVISAGAMVHSAFQMGIVTARSRMTADEHGK